jgi:hypothetical protein
MTKKLHDFLEGNRIVNRPVGQTPKQVPQDERNPVQQRASDLAARANEYDNPTQMTRDIAGPNVMQSLVKSRRDQAQPLRDRMAKSPLAQQAGDKELEGDIGYEGDDVIDQRRADTDAAQGILQQIDPRRANAGIERETERARKAGIRGNISTADKLERGAMIGLGDEDFTKQRDVAAALQNLRVADRNPNLPTIRLNGTPLSLIDPSYGLGLTSSGQGTGPYTEDELVSLFRNIAQTDFEGMPLLAGRAGDNTGLTDEERRWLPLQANPYHNTYRPEGYSDNPDVFQRTIDNDLRGHNLQLNQLANISPKYIDAITAPEGQEPEDWQITQEDAQARKERLALIYDVQRGGREDTDNAKIMALHKLSKLRDVSEDDIDLFEKLTLGGMNTGGQDKEYISNQISSSKGGNKSIDKKGSPDRYAADNFYKWRTNQYSGHYGGLNDQWIETLPEEDRQRLGDLAKEFTSSLHVPIEGQDYSEYTETAKNLDEQPFNVVPMEYYDGMQPGDMIDIFALEKEQRRLAKIDRRDRSPEQQQRLEDLIKIKDEANNNRNRSQIRTYLEQNGAEMGMPGNLSSIIQGDLEHGRSLSVGGRDHPTNWYTLDSHINQGRKNIPAQDYADSIVDAFNLTDRESALRYQEREMEMRNKKHILNQIAKLPDSDAKNELLNYINGTKFADLESMDFDDEPPVERPIRGVINESYISPVEEAPTTYNSFSSTIRRQITEAKDVVKYHRLLDKGYSTAKFYRESLEKQGYTFDRHGRVIG